MESLIKRKFKKVDKMQHRLARAGLIKISVDLSDFEEEVEVCQEMVEDGEEEVGWAAPDAAAP